MCTTTNTAEFQVHTGTVTITADKRRSTPVHDNVVTSTILIVTFCLKYTLLQAML